MKFSEYERIENKNEKKSWISSFDFEVSHLISEARLKNGLTQDELAKLIGTKQPSIARVENGSSLPSLDFLKKIALALNTSLVPPRFGFMPDTDSPSITIVYRAGPPEIRYLPCFITVQESKTNQRINLHI